MNYCYSTVYNYKWFKYFIEKNLTKLSVSYRNVFEKILNVIENLHV